jgi:hypothetical protein
MNENRTTSLSLVAIVSAIHQLAFQSGKETFHCRIVITITLPAHTGNHLVFGLELAVGVGAILTAAVRMVEQAGRWLPIGNGHLQS